MQDTPVQTQQSDKAASSVLAFPLVARLLALIGAALFALAAWLPWAHVYVAPLSPSGGVTSSVQLLLTPGSVGAPPLDSAFGAQGALFVWSALTVLGIPLAALAWMRVSKSFMWLIAGGYSLWVLFTLIISIISARELFGTATFNFTGVTFSPSSQKFAALRDVPRGLGLGLWLSGIALLICLIGLWALISAARRATPAMEPLFAKARPAAQTPGAGTLTFGLILWAIGFLWLAWASLGCPSFVLVSATCQGLSADGAMTYAISRFGVIVGPGNVYIAPDPLIGEYAISILLTVAALFIGVGVWRRGVSTALCGWATVWLVTAAAFGALAWYGVNLVVNDPTLAKFIGGPWRGESGILFTAGALLICLVGVGLLWFALLFHRTQTSSA